MLRKNSGAAQKRGRGTCWGGSILHSVSFTFTLQGRREKGSPEEGGKGY